MMTYDYFIRFFDSRRHHHEVRALKNMRDRASERERLLKLVLEVKELPPALQWQIQRELER